MATRDLDRLAKRVKAHRLELFPSRKAAADAAGISKDTWRRVEEGLEVWDSKLVHIDRALGWAVGSCIAIAEGGEPILAGEPRGGVSSAPRPSEEEVRKAALDAAMATMPGAAIGDVQAFIDRFVKDLRTAGEVGDDD
jgi:hypothetical protein